MKPGPLQSFLLFPPYFQMAASFATGQSNLTPAHLPLLKALLLTLHGKKKKKSSGRCFFRTRTTVERNPTTPAYQASSSPNWFLVKSSLTVQSLKELTQLGANRVRTTRTPSRLSSGERAHRAEVLIAHLSAWINRALEDLP